MSGSLIMIPCIEFYHREILRLKSSLLLVPRQLFVLTQIANFSNSSYVIISSTVFLIVAP